MKTIDKTQITLIHIAKAQLKLSEEAYRTMLSERYWVNSSKGLSYEEAHDLIEHFKGLGFAVRPRRQPARPKAPNLIALASQAELAKLAQLRDEYKGWRHANGYLGLMKKVIKKERVVTSRDASQMIECLKAMLRRQYK